MRAVLLLLFVSFFATSIAQQGKGISIFRNFSVTGKTVVDLDRQLHCANPDLKLPPNKAINSTSERFAIGHIQPSPFIAVSARYKIVNAKNVTIKIRFSTYNNTNDDDTKPNKGFIALTPDSHYEGNDGYTVSNLIYVDKKYEFFELKTEVIAATKPLVIEKMKLNFFSPYGNKNDAVKKIDFFTRKEYVAPKIESYTITNRSEPTEVDNVQACPCPLPTFVTRTQWNCPQGQGLVSGVGTSAAVTHLIVHHSAGANTATDWNAVVLSVWNYHTGTNGWSDVGYNWLIAPNGQLYEGRGSNSITQNVTGAHFCGTNGGTMGVCLLGTYTNGDATAAAKATLAKLLAWKCCQANIPASGIALHASSNLMLNRISGHRDGCATECPGTAFYNTLPALRIQVQDSINACGGTPPPPCVPSLKITATGCPNNTITFTPTNIQNGGTTPTYTWYLNNTQVATGNSYVLTNAVNGNKVYAQMTSNASCIAATQTPVNSDTIEVTCIVTTPIIEIDGLEYCTISPNPNNGNFVVQLKMNRTAQIQIAVLDANGKRIYTSNREKMQGIINKNITLKNASSGNYIVEINIDNKRITKKIIVE